MITDNISILKPHDHEENTHEYLDNHSNFSEFKVNGDY